MEVDCSASRTLEHAQRLRSNVSANRQALSEDNLINITITEVEKTLLS
jgi:hypothetical protein